MNEDSEDRQTWFVFEIRDPSPEAIALARTWLENQEALNADLESLTELVCVDRPNSDDLEGCPHVLVFTDGFEVGAEVSLSATEQLGVLEELTENDDPRAYNVFISPPLHP